MQVKKKMMMMMMLVHDERQTVAHTDASNHIHIIDDRFKLIASFSFNLSLNLIRKDTETYTLITLRIETI